MKHPIWLFALLLMTGPLLRAQPAQLSPLPPASPAESAPEVYRFAEAMPEFPGGNSKLAMFLGSRLNYPKEAVRDGVEGKVYAEFVVCEDGSLCQEKIVKGLSPECDREVLRVIRTMPRWNPGKKDGKPVKVYYRLPVQFHLAEEATDTKDPGAQKLKK